MKYILSFILFILISTCFSQNDSLEFKTFYYGNGNISSEGNFLKGKPEGYWKTYYVNGNLKSEGNRVQSQLSGRWIFYAENKDTVEIINYRNGIKNGWNIKFDSNRVVSKVLFLDGKISGISYDYKGNYITEIPYKNNLKHGIAFVYKDSSIIKLIEYKNGFKVSEKNVNRYLDDSLKNGSWVVFYPNRKLHIDKFYLNDTLSGYYREYDINGNLLKNIFYKNGKIIGQDSTSSNSILKQEFYENGNLKSSGYFSFGKPIGMHKEISQDNKITRGILYDDFGNIVGIGGLDKNNKRSGKWTFFNKNKIKISEGYYKKGKRTKEWIFYFDNGNIEQRGRYKNGKTNGKWIQYFSNKVILKIEEFKKGKLNGKFIQNNPSGSIFIEGWYYDNLLDKEWIYHYDSLIIHKFFKDGYKTGIWYSKYLNGKLEFKGEFIEGEANGKHIFYYSDGKIKEYQFYIYGSREKLWSRYDAFEQQNFTFLYKNDQLVKINGYKYKMDK